MLDYQALGVWQKAVALASDVYEMTKLLPTDERYGLVSQTRRAAVSVSTNIAEGAGRGTQRELVRFLRIAIGSSNEVESLTAVAVHLGLLTDRDTQRTRVGASECRRMLLALIAANS